MPDTDTKKGKRPDFTAYFVHDREGCPWVAIGAAWRHSDGEGFFLKLDLLPNSPGRIMLRTTKAQAEESAQ